MWQKFRIYSIERVVAKVNLIVFIQCLNELVINIITNLFWNCIRSSGFVNMIKHNDTILFGFF